MASLTAHSSLRGRMHTQTEASTPREYANTTFSARPIDLSPWKTTKELLYPVGQSVFCHYEQTLKKEEQESCTQPT